MHTELHLIASKLEIADRHRRIARAPRAKGSPRRSVPSMLLRLIRRRPSGRAALPEPVMRAASPADLVR